MEFIRKKLATRLAATTLRVLLSNLGRAIAGSFRVHKLTRTRLVKRGKARRKVVNEKEGTGLSIDSCIRLSRATNERKRRENERKIRAVRLVKGTRGIGSYFRYILAC